MHTHAWLTVTQCSAYNRIQTSSYTQKHTFGSLRLNADHIQAHTHTNKTQLTVIKEQHIPAHTHKHTHIWLTLFECTVYSDPHTQPKTAQSNTIHSLYKHKHTSHSYSVLSVYSTHRHKQTSLLLSEQHIPAHTHTQIPVTQCTLYNNTHIHTHTSLCINAQVIEHTNTHLSVI